MYYNKAGYEDGAFKNMTTPDDPTWNTMLKLAKTLATEKSDVTIGEWLADLPAEYASVAGIKDTFNKNYANDPVSSITETAAAFKVLNMISFNYASRNLLFREVDGTNSVTDAAMYTFSAAWLDQFTQYKGDYLLAYNNNGKYNLLDTSLTLIKNSKGEIDMEAYMGGEKLMVTPACYCASIAGKVQVALDRTIKDEKEFIEMFG